MSASVSPMSTSSTFVWSARRPSTTRGRSTTVAEAAVDLTRRRRGTGRSRRSAGAGGARRPRRRPACARNSATCARVASPTSISSVGGAALGLEPLQRRARARAPATSARTTAPTNPTSSGEHDDAAPPATQLGAGEHADRAHAAPLHRRPSLAPQHGGRAQAGGDPTGHERDRVRDQQHDGHREHHREHGTIGSATVPRSSASAVHAQRPTITPIGTPMTSARTRTSSPATRPTPRPADG